MIFNERIGSQATSLFKNLGGSQTNSELSMRSTAVRCPGMWLTMEDGREWDSILYTTIDADRDNCQVILNFIMSQTFEMLFQVTKRRDEIEASQIEYF